MVILIKAGTLKNGRYAHGVIFDGEKFLVVGGSVSGDLVTNEVCTLEGSSMTCVEQSPVLNFYTFYPELFLVSENFGKDPNDC